MSIKEHIRSIRETVGKEYKRPDPGKVLQFIEYLGSSNDAKEYLNSRGLQPETIEHFKLGYDPERDAISIPIYKKGELINIKYRFIRPKEQRYTSESNAETWLFNDDGLEIGRQLKGVLVVEGEFDAIAAWQAGIKNVVSTASGNQSYGVWIAELDNISKVYIAFDNDDSGKQAGKQFADRVGQSKCYEFNYPDGIKDASEFFSENSLEDFKEIAKKSTPYYSYEFKNVGDVIRSIREGEAPTIKSEWIPRVQIEQDWLLVLSGDTNIGKTTYSMNVAKDFATQGIPTLVMPFERGTVPVGKRFLQVYFDKTGEDLMFTSNTEWDEMIDDVVDLPIYFAVPKKSDIIDTIKKARRFFDVKVVIIDHLDYIMRHNTGGERDIANTLQEYKVLAQELGVVFIVVTHLRKRDASETRPNLHDLKGSSSLAQDPECVILLSSAEDGIVTVDIAKNKGHMGKYDFGINIETGVMNHDPNDF